MSDNVHDDMATIRQQIHFLLGNIHVGTSYLSAVRRILGAQPWSAHKEMIDTWPHREAASRWYRRHLIRLIVWQHRANRDLYRFVMSGHQQPAARHNPQA